MEERRSQLKTRGHDSKSEAEGVAMTSNRHAVNRKLHPPLLDPPRRPPPLLLLMTHASYFE